MALSESFQKALLDAAERIHLDAKTQNEWACQPTALENALRKGMGFTDLYPYYPAVIEDPDEYREKWMHGE